MSLNAIYRSSQPWPGNVTGLLFRFSQSSSLQMSGKRAKRGSIPSMEATGQQISGETIIVVLGASGDLAQKKTFPALFALYKQGLLPKDVHIVGYARSSEPILASRQSTDAQNLMMQSFTNAKQAT